MFFRNFFIIILFLLCIDHSLLAATLPTPKGLEKDVHFWEQIFAHYKSNECVFHDSWNVNVIYGIKKIRSKSRRGQRRELARQERSIVRALKRLGKGYSPKSSLERKIVRSIPKNYRHRSFYRKAAGRVRCQRGIANNFMVSLKRSKKYLPMIRHALRQRGLPRDLAYLPHLESGFNYKAHSKVGARGVWQLMPATARESGLKVNRWRDDRKNTSKSTRAAVKILHRNYKKTKSWPLAMTGYNYGINGIARGIRRVGTRDYMKFRRQHRSRSFGFAARNFYPSFLAVRNIARYYERYSGRKKLRQYIAYSTGSSPSRRLLF